MCVCVYIYTSKINEKIEDVGLNEDKKYENNKWSLNFHDNQNLKMLRTTSFFIPSFRSLLVLYPLSLP